VSGAIVGTSDAQTLTNKTLTSPNINENVALTATATELNILDGATLSTTELNYVDGVTSAIQTQIDTKAPTASPTFTGTVTLAADPGSALQAATKQYVDNVVSGVNFHESVVAATTGNLAGTYNNGTSGVGATITKATNGSIGTIDGATVIVGSRILLKSQTDPKENGIYTVTAVGSVSAPWVVTRATDADNNPSGEMENGDFCFVTGGSTNSGYGYINNSTASPIVIGTDDITYAVFNAAQVVTGGAGLAFDGNILNVGTASTDRIVVNADNIDLASGVATIGTYKSVTVDTYGRVTAGTKPTTLSGYGITDAAPINNASFTGTFSAPSGTITSTMIADATIVDADISTTAAIDLGKLADISTNAQTASYTLVLADKNKLVEMSVASGNTLTVPPNSSVAFPVGSQIRVLQTNTGQCTLTAGAGVTINGTPGLKLRTQWASATLIKRATDTWVAVGDLSA
jgi:phage-related tail fiber protein